MDKFSLKVGNKVLLEDINISFPKGRITHVLGGNGVGKSCFAKSCVGLLQGKGEIIGNEKTILIGSSSNIPEEFCSSDIVYILKKRFDDKDITDLFKLLEISKIPSKTPIKKLSDGQKQKLKLLSFLCGEPEVIILDEFTNALDKNSTMDLYVFFNKYVKKYNVIVINITHNLSDLEYMEGDHVYICNRKV